MTMISSIEISNPKTYFFTRMSSKYVTSDGPSTPLYSEIQFVALPSTPLLNRFKNKTMIAKWIFGT